MMRAESFIILRRKPIQVNTLTYMRAYTRSHVWCACHAVQVRVYMCACARARVYGYLYVC